MDAERAVLVATLVRAPSAAELAALAEQAAVLEVRADLAGELDPAALRRGFPGELLYTLRSKSEGGAFEAPAARRVERLLAAAAAGWDLIDLEARRDGTPEVLAAVTPERRLLSWHGGTPRLEELQGRWERVSEVPARWYKLVTLAEAHGQELVPLALLRSLGRRDVTAFARGAIGLWTRLLAPRLGAPLVFAAADAPAAPGQPSLARLRDDYGLPDMRPVRYLCGLVGDPVEHSLSPRLHNHAYREAGVEALYLPFHVERFGDFWLEVVESGALTDLGYPLRGLSITAPHKATALALAGAASPLAGYVGAANTLIVRDGVWEAETTDGDGVLGALRRRQIEIEGRRAAVLGAGAAGRAAAVALFRAGAEVVLVNRDAERLRHATTELRLPGLAWQEFDGAGYDLLVHATPLGRDAGDPLPLAVDRLAPHAVVIDLTYRREGPTRLVAAVRESGRQAIDGREVLLHQAVPQFELMTGRAMPVELARRILAAQAAAD